MGAREAKRRARHEALLIHERGLWAGGARHVGGLDEAGAGPWAGPVTAACVVLEPGPVEALIGADDSKKLPAARREALFDAIRTHALAFAIADASPEEIDSINIRAAGLLAMRRAFDAVQARLGRLDHLLIDARALDGLAVTQTAIVRGDSTSLSVAAASILAKVHRDRLMAEAALRWPVYGFERHKGYGTADHQAALAEHGPCPLHRRSFAPVRAAAGEPEPDPRETRPDAEARTAPERETEAGSAPPAETHPAQGELFGPAPARPSRRRARK